VIDTLSPSHLTESTASCSDYGPIDNENSFTCGSKGVKSNYKLDQSAMFSNRDSYLHVRIYGANQGGDEDPQGKGPFYFGTWMPDVHEFVYWVVATTHVDCNENDTWGKWEVHPRGLPDPQANRFYCTRDNKSYEGQKWDGDEELVEYRVANRWSNAFDPSDVTRNYKDNGAHDNYCSNRESDKFYFLGGHKGWGVDSVTWRLGRASARRQIDWFNGTWNRCNGNPTLLEVPDDV